MSKYVIQTLTSLTVSRVVCGPHLVVISIILGVLLLQQLSLSPLLLQGLLDERGHLTLLARTLSANHKPATTRVVRDIPGNTHTKSAINIEVSAACSRCSAHTAFNCHDSIIIL